VLALGFVAGTSMPGALTRASGSTTAAPAVVRDLAPADPAAAGFSSERLERLTGRMHELVSDGRLAGIVTLVARHGKVVSFEAVGKKDVRKPDAMEKDSIFRIYSMTKPITGVALMMLYEEGRWRMDDPVSKFIPEFRGIEVHTGENTNGTLKLEDQQHQMTMRELMTHSAGLGYGLTETHPVDRKFRELEVLTPTITLGEMMGRIAQVPLLAQPGSRWSYSIAVDVQGYLVEKLSGRPFDVFLRERIFDPLGMKDTAFYVPADKVARLAQVHVESADRPLEAAAEQQLVLMPDPTTPPPGPSGGGGLYSTAEDYLRFCQMLLDGGTFGGTRLLAPRTVEMMRTNHLSDEALATYRPGLGFGLDFAVVMDAGEAAVSTPNGSYSWAGAAGTWFWIDPATDVVFVGMIQHRGPAVGDAQVLSRNLTYQAIVN
jgi:CubicO group peptidase (beta-lactamase class C family)